MKQLFIVAMILLSSTSVWAQQDLNDPRYIYSLDEKNYEGKMIAYNISSERVSFLYKGKLYKDVDYTSFIYDSALVYNEIRHCFSRREAKQLTNERGIRNLYIVGEFESWRKYVADHSESKMYLRRLRGY